MKDCLLTMFKGVVNNDNLPYLNELRITVSAVDSALVKNNCIKLTFTEPTVIRSIDNTACIRAIQSLSEMERNTSEFNYSSEITAQAGAISIGFANTNSTIVVLGKENIRAINLPDGASGRSNIYIPDFKQLNSADNIESFMYYGPGAGVVSFKNNTVLRSVICSNTLVFQDWGLDIDSLPANTYTSFKIHGMKESMGNIVSFISRILAAGNTLPSEMQFLQTKCTGTIEDLFRVLNTNNIASFRVGTSVNITANGSSCWNRIYNLAISGGIGTLTDVTSGNVVRGKYNISSNTWTEWNPE